MAHNAHVTYDSARPDWKVTVDRVLTDRKRIKSEAITTARARLRAVGGGELVIHNMDGSIADKDTIAPGNDPRRIPG